MSRVLAPVLLVTAGAIAYANSLTNPFVFDDLPAIVGNPDIRQLWPPAWLNSAWHGSLSSRPLVMLSLALNYAMGGADAFSFRLVNLVLHLGCGLMLYLVADRAFLSPALKSRFGADGARRSPLYPTTLAPMRIWPSNWPPLAISTGHSTIMAVPLQSTPTTPTPTTTWAWC